MEGMIQTTLFGEEKILGIDFYKADFLRDAEADRFFAALSNLRWEQHVFSMYGEKIPAPRLFQWMGVPPCSLYGGTIHPIPWTEEALEIQSRVETAVRTHFNSLNINFYRNKNDYLGWHVDKESEGQWSSPIASVSLGAVREFQLRKRGGPNHPPNPPIPLAHGSLIVMPAGSQAHYQHRLKKATKPCGPRINLTFRVMPE
jgi:alkylated DNA repair dioxygenase AlkB